MSSDLLHRLRHLDVVVGHLRTELAVLQSAFGALLPVQSDQRAADPWGTADYLRAYV